jgi:two-component system, cell cycle sensor histidine kinase and response regulator CckA
MPISAPTRTSVRLLMVEDSEDDAALLILLLQNAGYELISERTDSAEGLARALTQKWDIVISDHSMPNFSGVEALKLVRAMDAEVPFIFVSGTIGEEVATDAMRIGAQDYVMKSNLKRLVPAVQRELRDVEERKERRRLDRRVQQLEKFEAIGRLVGGIAHDFNNMICAIMGWAEMGCAETQPEARMHSRFQKIREQSLRAGKLTSQLLTFAAGKIVQPRKINLNVLVQEEMSLLARIIGADIQVRVVAAPELHGTFADPSQIEQVLMNLCLNARDAMPDGGQLLIETQNVEIDGEFCREHAFARPGSYVQLSVCDTGTGMDEETLERMFEPFFTTKGGDKGTGLGLATVHAIVKQHDGFIFANSERGKGTTFRVYLPSASDAPAPSETTFYEKPQRGTETILLVEDHEGLRDTAQEILEGLGYEVLLASDGKEALELFKENFQHIDLIIIDVVMPLLSGTEAYLEMSALRPGLRVIFTTGYAPKAKYLESMVEKGALILQKPYSLASLSQMVRAALEQQVPLAGARR